MISDQVPKLIGDQFDRPSNMHGKTGPKWAVQMKLCVVDVRCRKATVLVRLMESSQSPRAWYSVDTSTRLPSPVKTSSSLRIRSTACPTMTLMSIRPTWRDSQILVGLLDLTFCCCWWNVGHKLHPVLSCATACIFLQLYLKTAVHVSLSRSLFQVFFVFLFVCDLVVPTVVLYYQCYYRSCSVM